MATRLGVALTCAFLLLFGLAVADDTLAAKLDPRLEAVFAAAGPNDLIPVYFVLDEQLEGAKLRAVGAALEAKDGRRRARVAALKELATRSQARLRVALADLADRGLAERVRPLWIGNIVAADLTRSEIERLARLSEVARVRYSPKVDISVDEKLSPLLPPEPLRSYMAPASFGVDAEIECGAQLMRAPEVWDDLGNTGAGAVIAVIDSGVCWYHPDIESQMWVNPGEDLDGDGVLFDADDENGIDDDGNGYVDDFVGYDIDNGDNDPNDDNSHGSHCAGTVAGDGTGGFQSGMAPDAEIMAIRVGLSFSDEPDVWEGMQYAADNGADAITMSLGWPHSNNPDRATWRQNCENTIDLGTAMVIAAGNEGSGNEPDNVRTPGDVPRIISVGAVNCSDSAAGFSSRGPVTWQDVAPYNDHPYPPGLIKPDVSAPGVDTRSHNKCSGYSYKSGTSMATPHVAGAVALMIAANPGLEHDDIKQLLEDTSVDLGAPGKDNTYGTGRVDAYEAVLLSATSDGVIAIREKAVSCSGTLSLTVSDADLKNAGQVTIEVSSDTEPAGESLTLDETNPNSGVFRGTIDVGEGSPVADGVVQVSPGDIVTATYIDADDGQGGTNVPKTDTADIDCRAPLISAVRADSIGLSAATIRWNTDEGADSTVVYGIGKPPTSEEKQGGARTEHSVRLSGLPECTVHYYLVRSADPYGNASEDDNAGTYYHFETLGDFGSGPQSCHGGQVRILDSDYSCADTLEFEVTDLDLNADTGAVDRASVMVTSGTELNAEIVEVVETGANTSVFRGSMPTGAGAPAADGVLQLTDGDTITVTYLDADDGTGAANTTIDTAVADCAAPLITDVDISAQTDARVTVTWTTGEPSNTRLEWGDSPALGTVIENSGLRTSHSVTLRDLSQCARYWFRITAADEYGHGAVADLDGEPFALHAGEIPGLYWKADFEDGAAGWSLDGEWEVGAPQGLGGSAGGRPDPTEAYNHTGVLGLDLSGQGARSGDYEAATWEMARSPVLDATTWQNSKLIFYRRLNVDSDDDAQLWVWTNAGRPIYGNDDTRVTESSFSMQEAAIAQLVDGQPSVQLEFRQRAGTDGGYSGWNIDDVIFKDGSLPDYGACGTCGGAPSFTGVATALDNDACGAGGVTVSWDAAQAWGNGGGGTYAVYRDLSAGFVPGPGNLVASGVGGASYHDTSAADGVAYHYLVRAETDETCGAGPNNGGVVDANTKTVPVTTSDTQPVPGTIADLDVQLIGEAHVRLAWTATAHAVRYNVYRAETPNPADLVLIGETATDVSRLAALPNVHLLGRRSYADLPAYAKAFDVGLIPFRINELTLAVNPIKLREYLSAGLPVVSTPLPEVRNYAEWVEIAETREAFVEACERAVASSADAAGRAARQAAMTKETWEAKVDEISTRLMATKGGAERTLSRPASPRPSPD